MTDTEAQAPAAQHQPSPWQVLAPVMDLVTPMAVRAAATLRLPDLMADGPAHLEELARRSGTDVDALGRVLRHLVCHGVFTEPKPGSFAVNDIAALLRSDHPSGMRTWLDLAGFGGQMDLAFTDLLHTVRTGQPAWENVFGAPFWQYMAENPAMSASFDATMAAGTEYVAAAAGSYDWSRARHVVDVGGGVGAFLAEVLRAHPDVQATLVDLPDTVRRGGAFLTERGLEERCALAGQSFFDALPAGGDVYVLVGVVHDWSDAEATRILQRCADAAADHGRVVIIESHGTSGEDAAAFAEMDLRMLVLCGGRERSVDDYSRLAAQAGLRVSDIHTTALGSVRIECEPAG